MRVIRGSGTDFGVLVHGLVFLRCTHCVDPRGEVGYRYEEGAPLHGDGDRETVVRLAFPGVCGIVLYPDCFLVYQEGDLLVPEEDITLVF